MILKIHTFDGSRTIDGALARRFGIEPTIQQQWSPWSDELVLHVRQRVLGTFPETVQHSYPETWWDAFKQRWFPVWALKRWPARLLTVTMEKFAVYPELELPPAPLPVPVLMMNFEVKE